MLLFFLLLLPILLLLSLPYSPSCAACLQIQCKRTAQWANTGPFPSLFPSPAAANSAALADCPGLISWERSAAPGGHHSAMGRNPNRTPVQSPLKWPKMGGTISFDPQPFSWGFVNLCPAILNSVPHAGKRFGISFNRRAQGGTRLPTAHVKDGPERHREGYV